tara:strand:- start:37185 stop:38429 length:1245 start_codon:yes stop_codon:yes gene_type:complete
MAVPFILLRLLLRSRRIPAYRQRWHERFARFDIESKWQHGLWVHTVSLGEIVAATPLIKAIQKRYPDLPITITTMTITGSERVRGTFGNEVFHVYVPYDLPTVVSRFLNKVKPKAVMIFETELWPNIMYACKKRHLPVMLANARLSERSAKGYRHISHTMKKMLSAITLLGAHAHADAERFVQLGLDNDKVQVTGSIKFETNIPASIFEQAEVLRDLWGRGRPVLIAASTHAGEEEIILDVFKQVAKSIPDALLVLVPRHPERFSAVIELCKEQGYHTVTRTSNEPCSMVTQVFVGDTMGELKLFFAAGDVAFVGGSLVKIGGHNVLEPASLGTPTITGPYMFNFEEINAVLTKAGALIQVFNPNELAENIIHLLQNSALRAEISEKAERVMKQNKGALAKNMALFAKLLNSTT